MGLFEHDVIPLHGGRRQIQCISVSTTRTVLLLHLVPLLAPQGHHDGKRIKSSRVSQPQLTFLTDTLSSPQSTSASGTFPN